MSYLINSRQYSAQQPLDVELAYTPAKNYLFDLDYLTTIAVEGDNASEFLQGQLSCDVRDVTTQQMRQGLMCNLKGRVLAILDVVSWMKHGLYLVVPEDLCAATQASLAKTALFSRVQLHQNPIKLFGLYVQNQDDLKPLGMELPADRYGVVCQENSCCYKIDESFYILMVQPDASDDLCDPFMMHHQYRGSLAWHALQLQHLRTEIYPESRGMFLPHRLNMHQTGYINFNKGCYKGQEIIARMHYRATQKHFLVCFDIQTSIVPQPELALYSDDGLSVVGEVVDYCCLGDDYYRVVASALISYQGEYVLA